MTRTRRLLTCLVFAAGAFASIATSRMFPEWRIRGEAPLELQLTPPAATPLYVDVFATLTGPLPIDGLHGEVDFDLEVSTSAIGTEDAVVTIRLAGWSEDTIRLAPLASQRVWLTGTWLNDCVESPCVGHLVLEIDPIVSASAPPVTISGWVRHELTGPAEDDDERAPPGLAVELEVIPRAPQ